MISLQAVLEICCHGPALGHNKYGDTPRFKLKINHNLLTDRKFNQNNGSGEGESHGQTGEPFICHPLIGVDWAAPPIWNHLRGETWGGAEDLAKVTYNSQRAVTLPLMTSHVGVST